MVRTLTWRTHAYRWRRWLIAAAAVLVIRMLLPLVLQRLIASQASTRLRARVVVGDVDLTLYRGGVALKDVAVFPATAGPDVAPLIAWKLFAVELRWLPLFHKVIELRDVVLDSPRMSAERLQDGGVNLAALLPPTGAPPAPSGTPAEGSPPSGWGFGVDRLTVRTGAIRFRDLMIAQSEPLEVELPAITVTGVQLRPGVYGQPTHAVLELHIDEGVLKIDSNVTMHADGIAAETGITAEHLPLRRARLYIPKVGWSELRGTLSADLTHRIDTNGSRHDVRGSVGLHDVTVRVPGLEDAALAWRALTVQVEQADLVEQRIAISKVDCDGLSVPVRSGGKEPFPVLAKLLSDTSGTAPAAAPSPVSSPAPAPAQPWHWSLAAAQLTDAKLLVLHDTTRLDAALAAEIHDLAGEGDQPAAVKLSVGVGDGTVNVDGKLRLVPIGFGGHVVVANLDVPQVGTVSGALAPEILQAARLALDMQLDGGSLASTPGDLTVAGTIALSHVQAAPPGLTGVGLGVGALSIVLDRLQLTGLLAPSAPTNQGDVHLSGKVHVSDPTVSVAGAQAPAASVKTIDLTLDDVSAPALLAKHGSNGAGATDSTIRVRGKLNLVEPRVTAANAKEFGVAAKSIDVGLDEALIPNPQQPQPAPVRVRLGNVSVTAPDIRVTRTKDGLVLPQFTGAPAGTPQPPPTAAPQPGAATPPSTTAPGVEISLTGFRLANGRVAFTDRAVKPYYSGVISPFEVDVKEARFPPAAANRVRLTAGVTPRGTIKAAGSMTPPSGTIEVNVEDLDLMPFNPYATAYSPYGIGAGSLTVRTQAAFSADGYKADSSIVLHELGVTGAEGDSLFQQNFGIPLTVALALLRDMSGNITLDVPVAADKAGLKVGIGTIVAGALRSALVGTLASPLKLVGMAIGGGGTGSPSAPPQIAFRAGRPEPTAESEPQLKQLATFVASRPGIGVTLEPVRSTHDIRWLREQALAAELGKPQGVFGTLKNIGKGAQRDRIAQALAARAADEPGELDADDSKALQELLDRRPAPRDEQLQALATARLAKIESALQNDYGVDAARISRGEPATETADAPPVVRLHIGPVRPSPAPG